MKLMMISSVVGKPVCSHSQGLIHISDSIRGDLLNKKGSGSPIDPCPNRADIVLLSLGAMIPRASI